MASVRRLIGEYGAWVGAALAVTVVLAWVTGWWLVLVYGAVNAAGSVLYLDGLDRRARSTRHRRRWWPVLTVLHLPVGVFGVLASKGGTDPLDTVLGDEDIRNHTAASNVYGFGRGHGKF